MQRSVLFGAGAVLVVVAGFLVLRSTTNRQVVHALDQGIDQLVARLPPGYAVRHGATDANPLTGTLTVHDLVVTHDGTTLWTADRVTVSGADGQALQDVFDPAAYPNGHPAWTDRRLLVADASASGVHAMAPGTDISIGSYTLHRLSGRPFMLPPTPENRAKSDFLADAALALSVDSAVARDERVASQVKGSTVVTVGDVSLSDYDSGRLGAFAMKTIVLDGDAKPRGGAFHMVLGGLGLKSLDVRDVLKDIQRSGRADRGQLAKLFYESADLSGLSIDVTHGPHVGIDELHGSQAVSGAGSSGKGYLHGFTMALGQTTLPPTAAPIVAAFGMTALTMDIDATTQTTADGQLSVHEDLALHDLGKLHVDAAVSGYDPSLAGPGHPLAPVLATTLHRGTITYEDGSLVNRIVTVAAAQTHTTPDLIRAQLAMPVVTLGLMVPDQPDIADQVTAFLNHPGTLTVTMNPPQTTTIADIAQAPAMSRAHLLGLHVTAK